MTDTRDQIRYDIAGAIASASNVPFVGSRQLRLADAVLAVPGVAAALRVFAAVESAEPYIYESEVGYKHERVKLCVGADTIDAGAMSHVFEWLRTIGRAGDDTPEAPK